MVSRKTINRTMKGLSFGLLASAASTLAFSANSPAAEADSSTSASQIAVSSPEATEEVQEIVVTAQRRSERLSDVPLSVTAVSGPALQAAGITDTTSLTLVTPGLRMDRLGVYTQPAIRGVTAASTSPGAEANVSMYVDGIYQPNQAANNIDLPDVVRVEVEKGPQGTLFGRNATGGAVQIFTRDPSFTPTGSFAVSQGNFHDFLTKGFFAAPIIDNVLAGSVSGLFENNDGWTRDLLRNGELTGKVRSRLVRGKLLFQPAEGMKFVLAAQYSRRQDDSLFLYSALDGNTSGRNPALSPGPLGPIATQPYTTSVNFPSVLDVRSLGLSLKSSFDLSVGTLSTVTAFQRDMIQVSADGDASPAEITSFTIQSPDKNFTQELNFASEKFWNVASIVTGLFFYKDDSGYTPLIGNFAGSPFTNYSAVRVRAEAAYLEANVDLAPGLVAIAGLRESHELRSVQYQGGLAAVFVGDALHQADWNAITPRASLRYEIAPHTNIYGTYSQGFKSGVYDLNSTATTPVNPETIKAFELGIKTSQSIFDANAAIFLYNYSNLQVQFNNGNFDALQNAGSARIYGLDLEGHMHPTKDFTITAGLSLLHARYADYNPATILVPITNGAGVPVGGNTENIAANLDGFQVSRAPDWTLNVGADYSHQFAYGTFGASVNAYHSATVPLEQSDRVLQPAYTQVNARLAFEPFQSKLTLSLWGKNLSNAKVIQSSFITTATDGVSYAPPRTYGVMAEYAF
jgi:iron complex outermembrane receptor protein